MVRAEDPVWREAHRIRLSFPYMMADFVGGGGGFTAAELACQAPWALSALQAYSRYRGSGETVWADLPYEKSMRADLLAVARSIRDRFRNFVVLGIGGSSLGTIALQRALLHPYHNHLPDASRGAPRLFVLDNVDPDWLSGLLELIDPAETCFNVISKSGSTAETMAQFLWIRRLLQERVGARYAEHLVATTDRVQGSLRPVAEAEGYRTFAVPDGVGGRFSVLSPVGLLPAAVVGIDIEELLAGAAYADQLAQVPELMGNSALLYALFNWLSYQRGRNELVMMPYAQALKELAEWFCQLWAESLGKALHRDGTPAYVGATPIKALGATDQHSQVQLYIEGPYNKVVNFVRVGSFATRLPIPADRLGQPAFDYLGGHTFNQLLDAEQVATAVALAHAGRPNMTWELAAINPFTLGQLIYTLEVATALVGEMCNIDAFDQPGVEGGKERTYALMGRMGYEAERDRLAAELRRAEESGFRI